MSDKYTPTTEEIREGYIGEPDHFMDPLVGAEFDRWLAEHDREVAAKAWTEGLHKAYNHRAGARHHTSSSASQSLCLRELPCDTDEDELNVERGRE